MPAPGLFTYGVGKCGMQSLTRMLIPFAPMQIEVRVNAVCPWLTRTATRLGIKEDGVVGGNTLV